jgi:hypothetical protein
MLIEIEIFYFKIIRKGRGMGFSVCYNNNNNNNNNNNTLQQMI